MYVRFIAICAFVACLLPSEAFADKRVALLIGNANYSSVSKLRNPESDVLLMKRTLDAAGFDTVLTGTNLKRDELVKVLRNFEDTAFGADIAVIYYSGHGMEMDGENYLIPVDASLASDRDVVDETVPLQRVVAAIDGAKRLKLIILDACRNNPFISTMKRYAATRSIDRGFARIENTRPDTLIAFAAKAGTTAVDGDGNNSPFAEALARRMVVPGDDVQMILRKVRDDVLAATNYKQEPFAYGSLGGELIPITKASAPAQAPPVIVPAPVVAPSSADSCQSAAAHWAEAKAANKVEFYQEHLRLFGACAFAGFAKAALERLQTSPKAVESGSPPLPVVRTKPVKVAVVPLQRPTAPIVQPKRIVRTTVPATPRFKLPTPAKVVAKPKPVLGPNDVPGLGNIPFSGGGHACANHIPDRPCE